MLKNQDPMMYELVLPLLIGSEQSINWFLEGKPPKLDELMRELFQSIESGVY